ncbi:MAG TPA: glycosyltransferase family 2 protein [Gemmatimonadales bacterium]|nr:glycosyltransferase family 2 protein [Gemmatimonadales bacterium]
MSVPPRVSVALPLYNEAAGIPELLRRVGAALDRTPGGPHEIVVVDDGSTDATLARLEAAAAIDDRLIVVSLSRNFGHQAALTAALDQVSGDVTVVMDGDLQDPPELIPQFLEHYAKGYDVVYAQRTHRKEAWWLRLSYYLFYRVFRRLSNVSVPVDAGDFGLMSRRVVEQLRLVPERHRFLRGLRSWVGFRQVGVAVERGERQTGKSKYGVRRLLGLAADGVFAFSIVPIRAAALLGAVAILVATAFALYALYAKLALRQSPQGFTALIVVITFLSGVNLLFLGIVGEYVGRVYEEVKRRPVYVVGRIIRRSAPPPPPVPPPR